MRPLAICGLSALLLAGCGQGARQNGEHRGEDHRHVVTKRGDHAGMGQRCLDDQSNAGLFQKQPGPQQHAARYEQHEAAIGREIRSVNRE